MTPIRKPFVAIFIVATALIAVATASLAQDSATTAINSFAISDGFLSDSASTAVTSGSVIDPALGAQELEAKTSGDIASVLFKINDWDVRLEHQAPYTVELPTDPGVIKVTAQPYDSNQQPGTPSTIWLNITLAEVNNTIRINTTPSRNGAVPLDGSVIEALSRETAATWIYLDSDQAYSRVDWWLNDPPDDRQDNIGQSTALDPPYYFGQPADTDQPSPVELSELTTGTHSITSTGALEDGTLVTNTAWFTFIAANDELATPEDAPAPDIADPTPIITPPTPPRVSLPPITIPPIPTIPPPTTTEPQLEAEEAPPAPPIIDEILSFIDSIEIITRSSQQQDAYALINNVTYQWLSPECLTRIIGAHNQPALRIDPDFTLDGLEPALPISCERIIEELGEHATFNRFVYSELDNKGTRHWVIVRNQDDTTNRRRINTECAEDLIANNEIVFAQIEPDKALDHPSGLPLKCDEALAYNTPRLPPEPVTTTTTTLPTNSTTTTTTTIAAPPGSEPTPSTAPPTTTAP